jgi:hypothetical protein
MPVLCSAALLFRGWLSLSRRHVSGIRKPAAPTAVASVRFCVHRSIDFDIGVLRNPFWFSPHPTRAMGFAVWSVSQPHTQVSGTSKERHVRGQGYLAAGQGQAAAEEFEKILGHPGIVRNQIIGALAHLQLGRAYVVSGDTTKARIAYQDFLTLWKDADPDIPVLKQAKAEYARLQ